MMQETAHSSDRVIPAPTAHGPVAPSPAGAVLEPLRILVVAFHFPPLAAAGTHRTLNFVRQLAMQGHSLGVVTTRGTDGFRSEPALLERIPASVRVARAWHCDPFLLLARLRGHATNPDERPQNRGTGSVATASYGAFDRGLDYLSRLADIPDRYASFILPAFVRGIALAASLRPQVIYSTAPPASAHLAALLLADVLGLPLVVDLRDPWAVNPFRNVPYASLRELDDALEALVVKRARRVILNTTLAERDYVARYGDPSKFLTIQNGISPDLLDLPRGSPPVDGPFELLHLGSIYGRRSPLPFVRAVARWRREDPDRAARFVVTQVGPIEDGGSLVREIAAQGVDPAFRIESSIPHRDAFMRSTRAHALLLLGVSGTEPEVQVPAKLFEYLAAGRPILALAKRDGAILATLQRAGADYVAADPDDEDSIHAALIELAVRLERSPNDPSGALGAGAQKFRYESLTAELLTVLRAAAGDTGHA